MRMVNTVTGPVAAGRLGRVLPHEHFLFGFCGFQGDQTLGGFRRDEYFANSKQAAADVQSYGIRTVVDATPNECGRNVRYLKEVSEATGLQIICATGYYYQTESAYAYWNFVSAFTNIEDAMYEMMKAEVTQGIEGTDIKAGVIKLASSEGVITPVEEALFRAAARVQQETGVVIITHTQAGSMGPEQARLLLSCGADPGKIVIGHMCDNLAMDYQQAVFDQGVFVNFDRFSLDGPLFHSPTNEERMDAVKALLDKGYGKQLLLSHDSVNVLLGRKLPESGPMQTAFLHSNMRGLRDSILPGLLSRGVTQEQIDQMMIANPARLFG